MKMNEKNVSLALLSRDTDARPFAESHKVNLKYRHKKFKRIASAEIEDRNDQEENQNILTNSWNNDAIVESRVDGTGTIHSNFVVNTSKHESTDVNDEQNQIDFRNVGSSMIDETTEGNLLYCGSTNGDIRTSHFESQLPNIPQNSSSCISSANCIMNRSTTHQEDAHSAKDEFSGRYRPYKPKFHKTVDCSVPSTEEDSENMPFKRSNYSLIDLSNESGVSIQQQAQMVFKDSNPMKPAELNPLNLSTSSVEMNRKPLLTVESMHGISSTHNSQNASYLDEPIGSPGPFLGKTRLVDDHNGRSKTKQSKQTVNCLNTLNYMDISNVDQSHVLHAEEEVLKQTNDHLATTTQKDELTNCPPNNKLIQSDPSLNAIDLSMDNCASGLRDQDTNEVSSVNLSASPVNLVSMQIAEVSSSVNTSLIVANEPHSKKSLPIVSKSEIVENIASEYMELANKEINSTNNDDQSPEMSIGSNKRALFCPQISVDDKKDSKRKSPPSNISFIQIDDGPLQCSLCSASFPKSSLLKMHMNIHYMNPERKFHCESCDKSFRTQNRLHKHTCFETKIPKTNKNPRPFNCADCAIAFRILGHLKKHLRSKTHIQSLENLQKLPSGTYAQIEKAQINLADIDTTDCDCSLASLKILAKKLKVDQNSIDKEKTDAQADEME